MKIIKCEPYKIDKTYTLEIDHPSHNYIIDLGTNKVVSRNSHATAYIVLTYRSLFLKAHYPTEWWAAVMSSCHREKLPKFMSVAKSEGIKFGNLDANALSPTFTVSGDTIAPGILSIKGVGETIVKKITTANQQYANIDEFVTTNGRMRSLIEPTIKMGGFNHQHPNKKAVWNWYLYKYGGEPKFKNAIKASFGWPRQDILNERQRLAKEFLGLYPNRKKIPTKIEKWLPTKPWSIIQPYNPDIELDAETNKFNSKLDITFDDILTLFPDDYILSEILAFEKKVLGYFWHSPLDVFKHDHTKGIRSARTSGEMECVIEDVQIKKANKSGTEYIKLIVTDGIDKAPIMIWNSDMATTDEAIFQEGVGIRIQVEWQPKFRSFNMIGGTVIIPLTRN